MLKRLITGLGNPGRQYFRTRHNLGFWALDVLAEKLEAPWKKTNCKAMVAECPYSSWRLTLAKPLTYVNLSGESIHCFFRKMQLQPQDLLVVCDDVNLPLGKIKIRQEGSAGGHHGLESIIEALGSNQFPRIRLGVKPLTGDLPDELSGFVLQPFPRGEEAIASESVRRAVDAILVILDDGLEKAMNQFNRKE